MQRNDPRLLLVVIPLPRMACLIAVKNGELARVVFLRDHRSARVFLGRRIRE